jgi:hypothetical protein
MSNNYHTQMENKSNMLNEIAANNKLLQAQQLNTNPINPAPMTAFSGTPINRGNHLTQPQMTPQQMQQMLLMQQMAQQQQMTPQQLMAIQQQFALAQQQAQLQSNGGSGEHAKYGLPQPPHNKESMDRVDDTDEIELSEQKPISSQPINPQLMTQTQQSVGGQQSVGIHQSVGVHQSNANPQQDPVVQTNQTNQLTPQEISARLQHQHKSLDKKLMFLRELEAKRSKENTTTEYVILPIALLIGFMILMYPATSKYIDKYIPSIYGTGNATLKNLFIRGLILVTLYMVVRFLTKFANK